MISRAEPVTNRAVSASVLATTAGSKGRRPLAREPPSTGEGLSNAIRTHTRTPNGGVCLEGHHPLERVPERFQVLNEGHPDVVVTRIDPVLCRLRQEAARDHLDTRSLP